MNASSNFSFCPAGGCAAAGGCAWGGRGLGKQHRRGERNHKCTSRCHEGATHSNSSLVLEAHNQQVTDLHAIVDSHEQNESRHSIVPAVSRLEA